MSANSPELNILDLDLFSAIQCIQHRLPIHGVDKLIAAVQDAYDSMSGLYFPDSAGLYDLRSTARRW